MDGLDEIIREFLSESAENLDEVERDLAALTRDPDSGALLASIFRAVHTIKGTSGFLAFSRLEELTHAGETLLARLRDRELTLTPTPGTTIEISSSHGECSFNVENLHDTGFSGTFTCSGVVAPNSTTPIDVKGTFAAGS